MAPYISILLLTLLALTRYVTVACLFYANAPCTNSLVSSSIPTMPISLYVLLTHWGTWSLDLVLFFSADSASLTVAIQFILYRDHSIVVNFILCLFLRPFFLYSTQRCDAPQFRISISFYAIYLRPFFLYSAQRCDAPQFRTSISFYAIYLWPFSLYPTQRCDAPQFRVSISSFIHAIYLWPFNQLYSNI